MTWSRKERGMRGGKKIIVWGMVVAVFLNTMPMEICAQTTKTEKTEVQIDWKRPYREGQVIVLFQDQVEQDMEKYPNKQLQMQALHGEVEQDKDMEVTEVYDFSEADSLTSQNDVEEEAATGEGKEENFIVGYVTSDTLSTKEMVKRLQENEAVRMVQPNYIIRASELTQDTYTDLQWSLQNTGQNGGSEGEDINISALCEKGEKTTAFHSVIALLDTGVDMQHPELKDCLWENMYQGWLPGEHGYDYVNRDEDPSDDNGHGTHCAGILAAEGDNNTGISGIAKNAKLMVLKCLDENGEGDIQQVINAYDYIYHAMQLGVPVAAVNNSWSGGFCDILDQIVDKVGKLGAVSVFAAGNSAKNLEEYKKEELQLGEIPQLTSPYAIEVAASNEKGELAQFTNYGVNHVTLAAPGTDILSTVSYDCFNPGIYTEEQRERLCAAYENYEEEQTPGYIQQENGRYFVTNVQSADQTEEQRSSLFGYPSQIEVHTKGGSIREEADVTVTQSMEEFFGTAGRALDIQVKGAKKGDRIYMVFPYELPANEVVSPQISMMAKAVSEIDPAEENEVYFYNLDHAVVQRALQQEMWGEGYGAELVILNNAGGQYWSHLRMDGDCNRSEDSHEMAMVLQMVCGKDGTYHLYLDDFGISKGTDEEESGSFGRYEFENGTSMAAPHVTGTMALLAQVFPELSVQERMALLCSSIRKTPEGEEKTGSGGILDLTKIENPQPILTECSFEKDGWLHIFGYGFEKANTSVWIDGKRVTASVVGNKELKVKAAAYKNRQVPIKVETLHGTTTKIVYLVKGKQEYINGGELELTKKEEADTQKNQVTTDGSNLYYYDDAMTSLYRIAVGKKENGIRAKTEVLLNLNEDGDDTVKTKIISNMVMMNSTIYALMSQEKEETGITQSVFLAEIRQTKEGAVWKKTGNLPSVYRNRTAMSLGAYNGRLYLIGGYDYGKKALSREVMLAKNLGGGQISWKKSAALPEGRGGGVCIQSGNRLYYVFGEVAQRANGTSSCPKILRYDGKVWRAVGEKLHPLIKTTITRGEKKFDSYRGNIGLCKDGILLSGLPCDGYGDTFLFRTKTGKYEPTEMNGITDPVNQCFCGSVVNDLLVGVCLTPQKATLQAATVNSGICAVRTSKSKNGTVRVSKKTFCPGEKVTISITPKKGYRIQCFVVNGKKVSGSKKTLYATKNISVKATFKRK